MTAEELIIAMAAEARIIPPVAYKLLWGLVSLAIQRGSNVVQVSMPWLAMYTGASRAGVAIAIDQIRNYVDVDSMPGRPLTFRLPEAWIPPQGPLFGGSGPITARRPRLSTVSTQTPSPPTNPSRNQATDQAATDPFSRQVWSVTGLPIRSLQPGIQAGLVKTHLKTSLPPIRNTRAPVESNRIEVTAVMADYLVIEKAFHTVEIRPDQREDAQILSEVIQMHRIHFDSAAAAASRRDPQVIARLLAIAPIEELCDTILQLKAELRPPGISDMWYFHVLLHRIRGINHKVTTSVIEQAKSKAPSNESTPPLFAEELVKATVTKVRKLG